MKEIRYYLFPYNLRQGNKIADKLSVSIKEMKELTIRFYSDKLFITNGKQPENSDYVIFNPGYYLTKEQSRQIASTITNKPLDTILTIREFDEKLFEMRNK